MTYNPILVDESAEYAFRKQIEHLLRSGNAPAAEAEILSALRRLAAVGHPLAVTTLQVDRDHIHVDQWKVLGALDESITAIGIDMSWPGHISAEPDSRGFLDPVIETNYYCDDVFPFSSSTRRELLKGYSDRGPAWTGEFEFCGNSIGIKGIGHIYGPIYSLGKLLDMRSSPSPDRDMAVIGACFVAVLVHRAVRVAIARLGMPRPLTVLVGSNESYPFIDAPVITPDEYEAIRPRPVWDPGPPQSEQRHTDAPKEAPKATWRQRAEQMTSDHQKLKEAARATAASMTPQQIEAALNRITDLLPVRDEKTRDVVRKATSLIASLTQLR